MTAITPSWVLAFSGGVIMVAAAIAVVVSAAFCTRSEPRWLVHWLRIAIGLVGARLLTRESVSLGLNPWWVAFILLHLAISMAFLAGYNILSILPPHRDTCRNHKRSSVVGRLSILVLCLAVSMVTGVTATIAQPAEEEDACTGVTAAGDVALDYEGHCILIEPDKGPVQGIFVRRIEDLEGVTIEGIVIMQTREGWQIITEEFFDDVEGDLATVAVGDGWHMELDQAE